MYSAPVICPLVPHAAFEYLCRRHLQNYAMFSENHKKSGCIEVICGSMFSGKTEELIRRLRRARFANQKIAIFKPAIDNRYSDVAVVSHDAHKLDSVPVSKASEILAVAPDVQVVGIDEAQFFDESLVDVCQTLADRGVRTLLQNIHYELPPVHEAVPFTLMRRESVRSLGGKETP